MNDNTKYLRRIKFLLSFGHPVTIRDLATLTITSEDEVRGALEQMQNDGVNIWSDGESAEIRSGGGPD